MASVNIFLTIISPYTAFLPMLFMAFGVLKKKSPVFITPWNLGLLFLFIWSMVAGVISMNAVSLAASFAILLYFFVSVYFQNYYNKDWKIENLFKSVALFSTGSAVIGIIEKFTAQYLGSIKWGYLFGIPQKDMLRQGYRIYGTLGNPNVAGTWYAAMILLCFYFFDNSSGFKKGVYGAGIFLFTWVLILTGSRGAALGLVLGLASYGFLRGIKKNMGFLIIILTFIVMFMLLPSDWLPWAHTLNSPMSHGLERSVMTRQEIWKNSLRMFAMKPITGWGLMGIYFADSSVFQFYLREPHAHNIWITVATTLGIVGLGGYIYMRLYVIKKIIFLLKKDCRLAPLLAGIQVAAMGHGLVDFTPMTPQGGMIFFGGSALICALSYTLSDSKAGSVFLFPLHPKRDKAA